VITKSAYEAVGTSNDNIRIEVPDTNKGSSKKSEFFLLFLYSQIAK